MLRNKKEVTKREETLPSTNVQKRGFENPIDQGDLIIPLAKVVQPTSDEAKDIKLGTLINSLTKEELPAEFIPIFHFKHWIRFNSRDKNDPNYDGNFDFGATIWRSNDPLDKRVQTESKWGPNDEPPAATTFLCFLSFFPGISHPLVVSFAKTSYKSGRQLLSTAQFREGDMFAYKYRLSSKYVENEKGKYFILLVDSVSKATENEFKVAESWWEKYHKRVKDIQVHDEGDGPSESSDGTELPGGGDIPF